MKIAPVDNDGNIIENLKKEVIDDYAPKGPQITIPLESPIIKNRVFLKVRKLDHYNGLPKLEIKTSGSAGIDLYAANFESIALNSIGSYAVVPTGIAIELPESYEAQIRPRSGLAAKEGLTVLNTPGTVDSDYRGEIKIILIKLTTGKFRIERGMRIAQMVVCGPLPRVEIGYVDTLSDTTRGTGGFGSTGV